MTDNPTNLLEDGDAAALLSAEYAASGEPVDDVARARVWRRLEGMLAIERKKRRRYAGLSAIALVAAGLALVVVPQGAFHTSDTQRIKGEGSSLPVTLLTYHLGADGALIPLTGDVKRQSDHPDEPVVFTVHAPTPSFFSLIRSEDSGDLVVLPMGIAPLGLTPALVKSGADIFGFHMEPGKHGRLCALAAASEAELRLLLANLPRSVPQLAPEACATW